MKSGILRIILVMAVLLAACGQEKDQGAEYLNITAAEALVELGYTNIKEFGGIIDWPYETA